MPFSTVAVPDYIPIAVNEGSFFSTTSPTLVIIILIDNRQ